jgi:hypothetical protein
MLDHVADLFTNFDYGTMERVYSAAIWVGNYAKQHKLGSFVFGLLLGGATTMSKQIFNRLDHVIAFFAGMPFYGRMVRYQSLMFARVFVGGAVAGTSPLFTTPIGLIEAKVHQNDESDNSMFIILATSVFPNLLAKLPGFSEFCWMNLYNSWYSQPLGPVMSTIMQEAFENAEDVEEKAGNPVVLGHFTPGSGTYASLVAGIFTLYAFDMVASGCLGTGDDLALNIMTKFSTPTLALHDAKYIINAALLFKIINSAAFCAKRDAVQYTVNFLIVNFMILYMERSHPFPIQIVEKLFPMIVLFTSAILLPVSEKCIYEAVDYVKDRFGGDSSEEEDHFEEEVQYERM